MKEHFDGAFIALGTFDGLHIGHKAVITAEKTEYRQKFALMFARHPLLDLKGENPGTLTTAVKEKQILDEWGVKPIYTNFADICSFSPEEFVDRVLINQYNAKSLACGFNYRFGKNAEGTSETLALICAQREIKLTVVDAVKYAGTPVSSTRIRNALRNGDMKDAKAMLGRYFSYDFEVLHGDERGRILGSPTINQFFDEGFTVPQYGVYASFTLIDGKKYPSVTNVGIRPTVGKSEKRSETNIVGFEGNLYGKRPEVFLVEKIRGEMRFASLEELSDRIAQDRKIALDILKGECIDGI